jgi:ABC-2 type transport system permease protein
MNWSQLGTVLWLRWRLSVNQWSRGGQVHFIITVIFAIGGLTAAAAGGIAGILAGVLALSKASPMVILTIWDVITAIFLFVWMTGTITAIQQSETIDINRMLHLPIAPRTLFLVNYIASHFTPGIILFVPGMLGLCLGLTLGRSWSMILLCPLVLGFIFMINAWTYCLRGWLVSLMTNPRRRRTVIAVITILFVLIAQLPNFLSNVVFRYEHHKAKNTVQSTPSDPQAVSSDQNSKKAVYLGILLKAHNYVPFLWMSKGAMSLAQGEVLPAILGSAGLFLIGGLGLRRAYRVTFRFYQGQAGTRAAVRKTKPQKVSTSDRILLERQLPGIAPEAAAMALAFFRSIMRAPEVKMALVNNIVMVLVFGGMFFFRHSVPIGENIKPFIATGSVIFMLFGISQLMFNQFGFDRGGFRQLVLLPVARNYILLGKNLANLPIAFVTGLIILVILKVMIHIPFLVIIATIFQSAAIFLLLSLLGNLMSIYIPYRIAPGTLKLNKVPALTVFLVALSHSLFPLAMVPIFLPPGLGFLFAKAGWFPAAMINVIFSLVLLAVIALAYRYSLPALGSLLQQREIKILGVVSREME